MFASSVKCSVSCHSLKLPYPFLMRIAHDPHSYLTVNSGMLPKEAHNDAGMIREPGREVTRSHSLSQTPKRTRTRVWCKRLEPPGKPEQTLLSCPPPCGPSTGWRSCHRLIGGASVGGLTLASFRKKRRDLSFQARAIPVCSPRCPISNLSPSTQPAYAECEAGCKPGSGHLPPDIAQFASAR